MKKQQEQENIHGIFSTEEVLTKHAPGRPAKKAKQYWLAQQISQDQIEVQPVNDNLIPTGKKRTVSRQELFAHFRPEPEFYLQGGIAPVFGDSSAEQHTDPEEESPALPRKGLPPQPLPDELRQIEGFEMTGPPEEMEKNARAGFGMALTYLKLGNTEKACDIFDRLARPEIPFETEHKHMFNEFGISLRKNKLYQAALEHYERADLLSAKDENLQHNIARAYYECNDLKSAIKHLQYALSLRPGHKESRQFLLYIARNYEEAFKQYSRAAALAEENE